MLTYTANEQRLSFQTLDLKLYALNQICNLVPCLVHDHILLYCKRY